MTQTQTKAESVTEVIIGSATEAFTSAMLVWFLGGVAISIAASFAGNMVPSLPPGFSSHAGHPKSWWHAMRGSAFTFFFALFFIHSLWLGFRGEEAGVGTRMHRIVSNLRENWFELIVSNAIGAWVAVLILGIMQNISLTQIIWNAISGAVLPIIQKISHFFVGDSTSSALGDWFAWYNGNQMKLTFWVIYLGSLCDDLGVPNFKTLARWTWRRVQKRRKERLSPLNSA